MKLPRVPHRWDLSPPRARRLQSELARLVDDIWPGGVVRLVTGVDASISRDGQRSIAAVVSYDLDRHEVREQEVAETALRFPYVPGLLSFREAPSVLSALRKLRHPPDVLLCDGQGLAHPRRFGLACHLGVITGLPTIGCAKSRLVGRYTEPGARRGSRRALVDRGDRIGTVLRTRDGVKPVYVSIGHRIDLPEAERVVLACATRYRLPEPQRLAHQLATRSRQASRCGTPGPVTSMR